MIDIQYKVAVTDQELRAYFAVRRAVFVDEQRLFEQDDRDLHDVNAIHLIAVARSSRQVIGAVRCYKSADDGVWYGGRLAVLAAQRHNGATIGSLLCKLAEMMVITRGARRFLAEVQVKNRRFFERLGWRREGEPMELHGAPHQLMAASLDQPWPGESSESGGGPGPLYLLVEALRSTPAWQHKRDLAALAEIGSNASPKVPSGDPRIGDDTAAIPEGAGYALLASEVVTPPLVAEDPYLAGRVAVLSNVNDVYAMGGRPTAIVDTLLGGTDAVRAEILRGLRDACSRYDVALAGGHLTAFPEGACSLTAAIYGRAERLIRSCAALPGDRLLYATSLEGQFISGFRFWSCSAHRRDDELRDDLEILPRLAESGLVDAGRDVSMAGVLGSLVMMLELSSVGAIVDLEAIPRPAAAEGHFLDWLLSVPSYGFLLAVRPRVAGEVECCFRARDIECQAIGEVVEDRQVRVRMSGAEETLWNFAEEPFTGLVPAHSARKVVEV